MNPANIVKLMNNGDIDTAKYFIQQHLRYLSIRPWLHVK